MEKKHLFNLVAFLFAISIMELSGVKPGFAYPVFVFAIVIGLGLLYNWCKQDSDADQANRR